MKPGYQTTEFWLSLSAAALAGVLGVLEKVDAPWAVVRVSLISCVYTILRISLKAKQTP